MKVVNIEDAPKSKQEKLDIYCESLANGLSRKEAYIAAGYSPHMAVQNAQKYHRSNAEYIQGYMAEHISLHVPTALKVILEVLNNPNEKGGIRLKAAEALLDRGGQAVKQKIEISAKDVKDMSTEELESEIAKLISENPTFASIFNPKESVRE